MILRELLKENSISDEFEADVLEVENMLRRRLSENEKNMIYGYWESGEYDPEDLAQLVRQKSGDVNDMGNRY